MGAHPGVQDGVAGVQFCLWAPSARSVALIGDCCGWDGRHLPLQQRLGGSWELFVPGLQPGERYKYEIRSQEGHCYEKADPYGFQHEVRPLQASLVADLNNYDWSDSHWLEHRDSRDPLNQPISVYEMHLGSWMHGSVDEPYIEPDGITDCP